MVIANKSELQKLQKTLLGLHNLQFIPEIGDTAQKLCQDYGLSNRLFIADAFIAAFALEYKIMLFTLNQKDFNYISEIQLYLTPN